MIRSRVRCSYQPAIPALRKKGTKKRGKKRKKKHSNKRVRHFCLTSVSVNLFHLCADWSKACFLPAEIERVLNSAMCFGRSFGPLMKYLRTYHTLRYSAAQKSQHRKHRDAQTLTNSRLSLAAWSTYSMQRLLGCLRPFAKEEGRT